MTSFRIEASGVTGRGARDEHPRHAPAASARRTASAAIIR
jgi:hypothetical protein